MSKRILSKILFIFFLFVFSSFPYTKNVFALAASPTSVIPEHIRNFNAEYVINLDGTVDVTETIDYYFSKESHGIFREIPLDKTNMDGDKFLMKVSNLSVFDANSNDLNYYDESTNSLFKVKIGSPDKFVIGDKTYIIKYKIHGALTYFTNHDELYWNITGVGWSVPIRNVSAKVILPDSINENITGNCFTGAYSSSTADCSYSINQNTVLYTTNVELYPYEGLTITTFYPTNIVAVLDPQKDNSALIEAIVVITIFVIFYLLVPIYLLIRVIPKLKKLDEEKRVVAAWFDPPKNNSGRELTSSEIGILYDKKGDIRDFTAGIVQLAQKGYLRIEELSKKGVFSTTDYKLTLLKPKDDALLTHEKKILDILFTDKTFNLSKLVNAISDASKGTKIQNPEEIGLDSIEKPEVKISELAKRTTMSTEISKFYSDISSNLVTDKIFLEDPVKKRNNWTAGVVFGSMFLNPLFTIASYLMMKSARRTSKGGEAFAVVESLNNFVKSQDKQLEFQAKNQFMFEKLLPYAIALGVEKIWVQRFKDIEFTKSDWYVSSSGYNALAFNSFASSFSSTVSKNVAMSSSRSSSGFSSGGGGFSGGGGGGGGGGSW